MFFEEITWNYWRGKNPAAGRAVDIEKGPRTTLDEGYPATFRGLSEPQLSAGLLSMQRKIVLQPSTAFALLNIQPRNALSLAPRFVSSQLREIIGPIRPISVLEHPIYQ